MENQERHEVTLSVEEKTAIAHEAQKRGTKLVASEKGLPMETVRAWIGAYCRKKSRVITTEAAPASSNGAIPLPAFNNDWQPEVQIKWLEVWDRQYTKN